MASLNNIIRALASRSRGDNTSKAIGDLSTAIVRDLSTALGRFDAVLADETRTTADKAKFLRQWVNTLKSNPNLSVADEILSSSISRLEKSRPAEVRLNMHQGILLAESLKEASQGERYRMVGSDARYLAILEEMPAAYFGLDQKAYSELIEYAHSTAMSPEESAARSELSADTKRIADLKSASTALLSAIESYIKQTKEDVKRADESDHLYQL